MYNRHLQALIRELLADFRIVYLTGPRQAGKTALARSVAGELGMRYFTLDDPDVREQARLAPDDLVRSAPRLALDEVQRELDLFLAVKRVVDSDRPRKNGRFVLTGSANLLLMQRVVRQRAGGRGEYF